MEFRLLGPLEVVDGDRLLALGGVKPRSLLALLLLHANEVVSTDRLIDELWGDEPPATAAKSVQVHVSRLRKELGEDRLHDPRARLCAARRAVRARPGAVRAARSPRRTARSPSHDPRRCARRSRSGAGPRSPISPTSSSLQTEIARLEEMRLAAIEERIDADLARGAHARSSASSRR